MYRVVVDTPRYIVIDKSVNANFHSENGKLGVAECLKRNLSVENLYPLHRLDQMTSGLLVFAKDIDTARNLNQQFARHQVSKFYLALSQRKPKKKQGLIRGDMVKGRRGSWKLATTMDNPATTRFISSSVSPGLRLYLLKPLTGKTHQLRVAMKSIGAPILGDARYGSGDQNDADRGYLHAFCLSFLFEGEELRFQSIPSQGEYFVSAAFRAALSAYQDPWSLPWPD